MTAVVSSTFNIADHLERVAQQFPYKRAIVFPHSRDAKGRVAYTHWTYQQLLQECDRVAYAFQRVGIQRNTRVLLMVKPSLEFVAVAFALFKIGAIPILIDPGMGLKRMIRCIKEVEPEAFIGIPKAHLLKRLYKKTFHTIKISIILGKKSIWKGHALEDILQPYSAPFPQAPTQADDIAGIFFTSGSTGIPKGVEFFHAQMDAQVRFLQEHYHIQPDEVDLPTFPLFLLFSPAFGVTCVIPEMDFTAPAKVDPAKIVQAIQSNGVTYTFGSPALWNRVSRYCIENNIQLPSIRRVLIAGAPVPASVIARFSQIIPNGEAFTPYGATEALPVCSLGHREICQETLPKTKEGAGTCVGYTFSGVTLKIIQISEDPIPTWSDDLEVPLGEVGEITVKGPMVTKVYHRREKETQAAKIYQGEEVWHRMGDLGYQDTQGRVWFCGRKKHRVVTPTKTYFSVQVEGIFNAEPDIWRTALVGVQNQGENHLVLCIEFQPNQWPKNATSRRLKLKQLAEKYQLPIHSFLFYPGVFPVDRRHNAKIEREELAKWATLWLDTGKLS